MEVTREHKRRTLMHRAWHTHQPITRHENFNPENVGKKATNER